MCSLVHYIHTYTYIYEAFLQKAEQATLGLRSHSELELSGFCPFGTAPLYSLGSPSFTAAGI